MAERSEGGDMTSSWWSGWLQTAKEKGSAALDMVAKDLAEFGCIMQKDTGHAVEVTSSTLKESLKAEKTSAAKEKLTKGLNTLLDGISKAMYVPPDDEGQIPIIAPGSDCYDRAKARLHALQVDIGTYKHEPSGSPETYGMWCEGFDLEGKRGEISEMLVSKVEVRALYTKLVPSCVSHVEFWRRYFYKVHQLQVDQARKEALMRRAEDSRAEDTISWDDDWSGDELAAEDSGSDWEKLPRPGHLQKTLPAAPALTTATPSLFVPDELPVVSRCVEESVSTSADQWQLRESSSENEKQSEKQVKEQCEEENRLPHCQETNEQHVDIAGITLELPSDSQAAGVGVSRETAGQLMAKLKAMAADKVLAGSRREEREQDLQQESAIAEVMSAESALVGQDSPACPQPQLNSLPSTSACPQTLLSNSPSTSACLSEEPSSHQPERASEDVSVSLEETALDRAEKLDTVDVSPASVGSDHPTQEAYAAVPVVSAGAGPAVALQPALSVAVESEVEHELKTTERGDLVVVGSDHGSPVSNTSDNRGKSDLEDDWDQDMDMELTAEEIALADELLNKVNMGENTNLEDDWEDWQ